jgi:hypothetical protein
VGNPEGTDWTLILEHEKEFSHEEFQDICEEALTQVLDEEYNELGRSFVCTLDTDKVFKKLHRLGFQIPQQKQVQYYLEPYFGRENIKSKKLLAAIDRKDKIDGREV